MFTTLTQQIRSFPKEDLLRIINTYPFNFKGEEYYLFNYVETRKFDIGFELEFLECLKITEKKLAFEIIGSMLELYGINFIGVGIKISIIPEMRPTAFYNGIDEECLTERLIFLEPDSIWSFSPTKKCADIIIPLELFKLIRFFQNGENLIYARKNYWTISMPTKKISSLILV